MKYRTTKKAVKAGYSTIYAIGYGNVQHLLYFSNPVAYTANQYGWASDIYDMGNGIAISTGYAPIGVHIEYDLIYSFDQQAAAVIYDHDIPYDEKPFMIKRLIRRFLKLASEHTIKGGAKA